MNIRNLLVAGAVVLAALLAYLLATDPGPAGRDATRSAAALPEAVAPPLDREEGSSRRAPLAEWAPPKGAGATAGTMPKPLPPIGAPLAAIAADLRDRAREGDARAACRLAFELERCRRLRSTRGFAQRSREYSRESAFPEDVRQRQSGMADFYEALARRDEAVCEGIDPREATGGWRYALQAAQSGHLPSMIRFAGGRMLFDGNPPGRNLDGWIALRDRGPAWLEAGIDEGYPEAFETGHLAYARGEILGIAFPRDPVRSVALALALANAGTPAERERSLGNARFVEKGEGLAPAQVEEARLLSESLAARLRARAAPGSVDFTRGTWARDDGSHCEAPR